MWKWRIVHVCLLYTKKKQRSANIACTDSYQALRSKGRRENKTSQEKITRARSREGGHHFLLLDWNELM